MNRREFIQVGAAASVLGLGCSSTRQVAARPDGGKGGKPSYHVFSKMFQPPVTKSPEELCDLMKGAGFDGIQWTVRPKGHVLPENVRAELPRLCRIAESRGLRNVSICTAITDGFAPLSREIAKTAADCGITLLRPGYYFYDAKKETFRQSLDRIRRGFASLAALGEETGVKPAYQNHSSWGPSVFGGIVWDDYECLRDLDPRYVGMEYDPMHAVYETNLSWSHGFGLIAPWIAAIDLKDFHYGLDRKNAKKMAKQMVASGEGVVPWDEVKKLQKANGVEVPYIVHFEYKFDQTDLKASVRRELEGFRRVFG